MLRGDRNVVFNLRNSRSRPCGAFRVRLFGPRTHAAVELDDAVVTLNRDAPGVQFGAPLERLLDLALDIRGSDSRLHLDFVGDAHDSRQLLDGRLGDRLLKLPIDGSFKRHPTVFDGHFDLFGGQADMTLAWTAARAISGSVRVVLRPSQRRL